jgi:hypothetical protein
MDGTRTSVPAVDPMTDGELRVWRLAEMVQHLTQCPPTRALHAVQVSMRRPPETTDEALEVVARAMISLKSGIDLRDQIDLP